jgi:hypothetical protein
MSSNWKNIVALTRWDAAFKREIQIPHAIITLINSCEEPKSFTENHSMNRKCFYEASGVFRN